MILIVMLYSAEDVKYQKTSIKKKRFKSKIKKDRPEKTVPPVTAISIAYWFIMFGYIGKF